MSPDSTRTALALREELHALLWATASFGRLLVDLRPGDRAVHDGIGDGLQAFMAIVDAVDQDDIEGVRRSAGRALVAVEALWAATQEARLATPELRFDLLGVIEFFLQIDTLTQKNSSCDKHLQNRLSPTPCAFGAD